MTVWSGLPELPSENIKDLEGNTPRSDGCFGIKAHMPENGSPVGWSLTILTAQKEVVLKDSPDAIITEVKLRGAEGQQLNLQRTLHGWSAYHDPSSGLGGRGFSMSELDGLSHSVTGFPIKNAEVVTSNPSRFIGAGSGYRSAGV